VVVDAALPEVEATGSPADPVEGSEKRGTGHPALPVPAGNRIAGRESQPCLARARGSSGSESRRPPA
jgi:hypothetical protein